MSRYIIWDHESTVITPSGEVFTPQQWEDRYPAASLIDYVMSGSSMNGAIMQEYDSMIDIYRRQGCDFTGCTTKQSYLDRAEQFEDEQAEAEEQRRQEEAEAQAALIEEQRNNNLRIADALEDLAMLSMPDMDLEDL